MNMWWAATHILDLIVCNVCNVFQHSHYIMGSSHYADRGAGPKAQVALLLSLLSLHLSLPDDPLEVSDQILVTGLDLQPLP